MNHTKKSYRSTRSHSRFQPLSPFESSDCGVYAIELNPSVLEDPSFVRRNPKYVPGKPCVYVGMSSLCPEERAAEHLSGTKNVSRLVHTYGICLRMDLVRDRKRVRRTWAFQIERRLARELRSQGFGVWQA